MKIIINDLHVVDFINVSISSAIDEIASKFAFTSYFDSTNEAHKDIFKPLSFNKVKIYDSDDDLMLSGVIIGVSFSSNSASSVVAVSGYSLSGVLGDCSIPLSMFPLESNRRSLKDIIDHYIKPFKIKFAPPAALNSVINQRYTKTTSEVGEKIGEYFTRLAIQKNLILTHDVEGNLTIVQLNNNVKWRFVLEENTNMQYNVNSQGVHSEIGVIRQLNKKQGGGSIRETINNPLISEYRPIVKKLTNSEDANMSESKKAILASEMDGIELTINKPTWIDTLRVGDTIEVLNPDVFLFNYTKFIIKSIEGSATASQSVMSITAVLPEALIR